MAQFLVVTHVILLQTPSPQFRNYLPLVIMTPLVAVMSRNTTRPSPNHNRVGKAITALIALIALVITLTSFMIDALALIIYASIHHPGYNLDYTSHAN
jgi:hypothetical protein